mgnify:FL=1
MVSTISNSLDRLGYNYRQLVNNPLQTVYRMGMGLENGKADCIIDIRSQNKHVLIYTICSINIPMAKRKAISEFITRANHSLILGNFEMDFSDGEVRYKCSFAYDDTFPLSDEIVIRNLLISFHTLDKYLPGIMSVVYANVLPENAISQIEDSPNPGNN